MAKVHEHIHWGLILIGIAGFLVSSFYLIYSNLIGGFFLSLFFMILFLEAFILRVQHNHTHKTRHKHHPEYFPLSSNFMLTSIVGFVGSMVVVIPLSFSWGVTFALVFGIMFISSMINMTRGPLVGSEKEELYMAELSIHDKTRKHKFKAD